MITITIEGPQGSEKTKIAHALQEYFMIVGKTSFLKEEFTEKSLEKNLKNIDVLISTVTK